jgi:hypothetical protein
MADADVPSVGKIYDACQQLHEHARNFQGLSATRRTTVKNLVHSRWNMLNSDIHCAGYLLEPEFVGHVNATSIKVNCYNRRRLQMGHSELCNESVISYGYLYLSLWYCWYCCHQLCCCPIGT